MVCRDTENKPINFSCLIWLVCWWLFLHSMCYKSKGEQQCSFIDLDIFNLHFRGKFDFTYLRLITNLPEDWNGWFLHVWFLLLLILKAWNTESHRWHRDPVDGRRRPVLNLIPDIPTYFPWLVNVFQTTSLHSGNSLQLFSTCDRCTNLHGRTKIGVSEALHLNISLLYVRSCAGSCGVASNRDVFVVEDELKTKTENLNQQTQTIRPFMICNRPW